MHYTCSRFSAAAMDFEPGQALGQYRITQKIGEGGMGAVYKADQPSVPRAVVIKVLSSSFAEYADAGERFQRELKMITRLEHPHILPVYDYGEVAGRPYIVMRFMNGGSLQDRLEAGMMKRPDVLRVLDQVAEALDFAHDQGIIHRDLKPANILLDESGNAYLADFGLAKTVGGTHDLTADGSVLGSPTYMSPEQARGVKLDRRSDVYAFAILIYRALSGRLPFEADSAWGYITKHLNEEPLSIRTFAPGLPAELDTVLGAGLAKDPASRPERATALMAAVRAALSGETDVSTRIPSAATRTPTGFTSAPSGTLFSPAPPASVRAAVAAPAHRPSWRLPVVLGIGGLGLLAVGVVAAVLLYLASTRIGAPSLSTYPVGDQPRALLFDGQAMWVANYFDNTLTRLAASGCAGSSQDCGLALGTYPVDSLPSAMAFDGNRLWVANSLHQTLWVLDPASGATDATYQLSHVPTALLWADSFLWIANDIAGTVTKVSGDGQILADVGVGANLDASGGPVGLAHDGTSLWVILKGDQSLVRMDPAGPTVEDRFPLDGEPTAIVFDGTSIWVAIKDPGRLMRIRASDPSNVQRLDLGSAAVALSYDGSEVWVAAPEAGKIYRVDPVAFRVKASVEVAGFPVALQAVSCGEGCVDIWTANNSADSVTRIAIR
ncbi:MAG TPA: protein kinase [Anaerolineales bacterium]|nr:protein kinase [Anaerolineales bacterium]